MSGDIPKARTLFEKAVAEDSDYPMYYYNLACADVEEENLAGTRNHLQQAFARVRLCPTQLKTIHSCLTAKIGSFGNSWKAFTRNKISYPPALIQIPIVTAMRKKSRMA
jgi:hypothetical protein